MKALTSPQINSAANTIGFFLPKECASHVSFVGASQVSLSGNFNNWAHDVLLMHEDEDGIWKIEIPMLPEGKYHYKFFVDDKIWMEDVDNPNREPDGKTGFNSIFTIQA